MATTTEQSRTAEPDGAGTVRPDGPHLSGRTAERSGDTLHTQSAERFRITSWSVAWTRSDGRSGSIDWLGKQAAEFYAQDLLELGCITTQVIRHN